MDMTMDVGIKINCDNAAFEDSNCGPELARILYQLAEELNGLTTEGVASFSGRMLRDINGNPVGRMDVARQQRLTKRR